MSAEVLLSQAIAADIGIAVRTNDGKQALHTLSLARSKDPLFNDIIVSISKKSTDIIYLRKASVPLPERSNAET